MNLLSQELVDQVIDYLHDNTPALRACSLVCRVWLNSSRVHKFWQVRLYKRRTIDTCLIAAPFIRHLTLYFTPRDRIFCDLQKCCNVRTLSIKNLSGTVRAPHSLYCFPMLHTLKFSLCTFPNRADFIRFICGFPRLASISTSGIGWKANEKLLNEEIHLPASPPLNGSFIFEDYMRTDDALFFELLPRLPGGLHFHSITFRAPKAYTPSLNALLAACGPSLKSLKVGRGSMYEHGEF